MKKQRQKDIEKMAEGIGQHDDSTNYDDIPKLEGKTFEEITAVAVLQIPINQIKPINQRIFCIETDPGEMRTKGGIIIATDYKTSEAKGSRKRNLRRYFVVDSADDCSNKYSRGDEVSPFIPDEAEEWSFPKVYDFYTKKVYTVLHESELAGISKIKHEAEKEEGE